MEEVLKTDVVLVEKLNNMKKRNTPPDKSWVNGKYKNGEINVSMETVSVNDPEFFAQGDDARIIINDIYQIWVNGYMTQEQAFNEWILNNL